MQAWVEMWVLSIFDKKKQKSARDIGVGAV